ncbi:hypothetical protein BDQ17DRAFT_1330449 [Cyathus striatus]|nr:hypothetical protein BDQ17DRAFT_1330449 [Cyathus striatus]
MSNDECPSVGSVPDPIQTRHRTRIAEQITAAGPPVDAGHPYRPVPPRLQGKTRLAGEQFFRLLVQTLPQIPATRITPFHQGYMAGHNWLSRPTLQASILLAFEWNENHCHPMNQHWDRRRLHKGPGLGASGPPPCQSLSPAPSLITSSTPMRASLPPSPLPGTSAAFFSGNPAQPSEAGALVCII